MTDHLTELAPSSSQPISVREATDLAQAMGQSLNTALLYGVEHKVAQASLERSYPAVASFIERCGPLHVSIVDGELLFNGTSANGAPLAGSLAGRLTARNLLSFVMAPGLSLEEYRTFLALLITPPAPVNATQSASDAMESLGFQHIEARNVTYRRVIEGDDALATAETVGSGDAENPVTLPVDLANVVAFLKDDPTASLNRGREAIQHLAADAGKLAELILRTATIREQTADLASGESLTDLVVGCLNRVTETLIQSPASRTPKGHKQVKRTLVLLEGQLLNQLQSLSGGTTDRDAVSAAFAEAGEDLDVESLTEKYMKSRRVTAKTEARLKKVIERVGGDPRQENELRDRLMEQGLSQEGWEELVVTRTVPAAGSLPPDSELKEIKTLTLLLSQLGATLARPRDSTSGVEEAKLQTLIAETGEQMQALAVSTEKKIDSFRDAAARTHTPSRKALLEMLAEIAQELSQPLTIMNATLEMLRGQRSGPITPAQSELLTLAAESGTQLGHLVTCLMRVAGTPLGLHPDREILRKAYQVGGAPFAT